MWRIILTIALAAVAGPTAAAQMVERASPSAEILTGAEMTTEPSARALIEGIKKGDLARVTYLLQNGISPDITDEDRRPALHLAVKENRRDIAEILLVHGAKVDVEYDESATPLQTAATFGSEDMVKLLIAHGADVNDKDNGGHTALLLATFGVAYKKVPREIAAIIFDEETAAVFASMGNQHMQIVKLLISHGADVNAQAEDCGFTPLMIAAMGGQVELTRTLLAHGAKVDLTTGEWTALKFTELGQSPVELQELLDNEPEPESRQAVSTWLETTKATRREVAEILRQAGARN